MSSSEVLILAPSDEAFALENPASRKRKRLRRKLIAACALLLVAVIASLIIVGQFVDAPSTIRFALKSKLEEPPLPFNPAELSASDPNALKVLTSDQAQAANAARPISTLANPAARPMILSPHVGTDRDRALDCLAAAMYYESAFEPEAGQRAVAQVVLNRLRHPIYPHTVCGVVFQGSERTTGCQFSFTCDGSLSRAPNPQVWKRVSRIADEVLSGEVYRPVGLATHYHADYVVPYWADKLVKSAVIGHHIFYRIPGSYGGQSAFNRNYEGNEPAAIEKDAAGLFHLADGYQPPLAVAPPPSPAQHTVIDTFGRPIDDGNSRTSASTASATDLPAATIPLAHTANAETGRPGKVASRMKRWVLPNDAVKPQPDFKRLEYEPLD